MYYAIEIIAGRHYTIRRVSRCCVEPTNRIAYQSLEAAQAAAREMGYQIKIVGDIWQIIGK